MPGILDTLREFFTGEPSPNGPGAFSMFNSTATNFDSSNVRPEVQLAANTPRGQKVPGGFGEAFQAGVTGISVQQLRAQQAVAMLNQLKAQKAQREERKRQQFEVIRKPTLAKTQKLLKDFRKFQKAQAAKRGLDTATLPAPKATDLIRFARNAGVDFSSVQMQLFQEDPETLSFLAGEGIVDLEQEAKLRQQRLHREQIADLQLRNTIQKTAIEHAQQQQNLARVLPQLFGGYPQAGRVPGATASPPGAATPLAVSPQPTGARSPLVQAGDSPATQQLLQGVQPSTRDVALQGVPRPQGSLSPPEQVSGATGANRLPEGVQLQLNVPGGGKLTIDGQGALPSTLSSTQANELARRRLGSVLPDPESFELFPEGTSVSRKTLNESIAEAGRNLRSSFTQEGRAALLDRRIEASRHKQAQAQSFKRELQRLKSGDIAAGQLRKGAIRAFLQDRAQQHQLDLQTNRLTTRERLQHENNKASLELTLSRVNAQAQTQFTLQSIRGDAKTALAAAQAAEKAGAGTMRGVLTAAIRENPGLAINLLESLGDAPPESKQQLFETVRGAVSDYADQQARQTIQERISQILDKRGSGGQTVARLRNEASRWPAGSKERELLNARANDVLAANKASAAKTVFNTGNKSSVDAAAQKKMAAGRSTLSLIDRLKETIDQTTITGIGGLKNSLQNFFRGTQIDLSREGILSSNIEDSAKKLFDEKLEEGRFLANTLRYSIARMLDSGRLSDQDIERVNIGTSVIKTQSDLIAAIKAGERFAMDELLNAKATHDAGFNKQLDAIERDNIISVAASNDFTGQELRDQLQRILLKTDVFATRSLLNELVKAVEQRRAN